MPTIINEVKNEVRRYLLGQLAEADEERLELRLLTDSAFAEEFDTVVDEITDEYIGNELEGEERKRVEQYFLRSSERRQKVQFADELMQRAAAERRAPRAAVVPTPPGWFERLSLFWTSQPISMRTAVIVVTIVIVLGIGFLMWPSRNPGTYTALTLPLSTSDRAGGGETKTTRFEPGSAGIRLELALPEHAREAKSYRVELLDEQQRSRNVTVAGRTAQSLIVTIPASEISRGTYIIRVYADEQRVRGSYYFNVE